MSLRLDLIYEQFNGPDAIWPVGETVDVGRLHDAVLGLVVELRALESALSSQVSRGDDETIAPTPARVGEPSASPAAQTRTSEESSRSSSDGSGSNPPLVAGSAKESTSPGPARAATEDGDARPVKPSSGRGPRRSEDVKRNVRPIKR